MPAQLFSGTFWSATHEPLSRLVVLTRTAAPVLDLSALGAEATALDAALRSVDRRQTAALLDFRLAPPLSPPVSENDLASRQLWALLGFRCYAFVVQTALGKLQMHRVGRERGIPYGVFFEVLEARLFCRTQLAALGPPAGGARSREV